jgi:hypothetical protein
MSLVEERIDRSSVCCPLETLRLGQRQLGSGYYGLAIQLLRVTSVLDGLYISRGGTVRVEISPFASCPRLCRSVIGNIRVVLHSGDSYKESTAVLLWTFFIPT